MTVIDTVPLPGTSLAPKMCAFTGSKTPPVVSVAVDDPGGTSATVSPHLVDTYSTHSGSLVSRAVGPTAGNTPSACIKIPHTLTGTASRHSTSNLGTYVITVGAATVPRTLLNPKKGMGHHSECTCSRANRPFATEASK